MIRRQTLAFLSCLILIPGGSFAQAATPTGPTIPDTQPGRALAAWLSAFDSDDAQTYRSFLETWEPDELKYFNDDIQFRIETGGFDLREIESSTSKTIVAIVEDRGNEKFARVKLTVEPVAPNRVASFPFEPIPTPTRFEPAHLNEDELLSTTRRRLSQAAATGRFSGAVLIAHNGNAVFEQAYGLADRQTNTANTLDTRFRIGSMNKMFTAVAVLQLAQAGKIQLDAPLAKYLPDYPNKALATQVTIGDLLTHTGGTGDIFGPKFDAHRLELRTLSDYEKLYGTRAPQFQPGTHWSYSNYGFILLGLVIEKVTGESYYDYVQQHIYDEAGMSSTGSHPENQDVPDRSIGYTLDEKNNWQPNSDTLPFRGSSAGGGYSTVGDLLRFANALLENKMLNPQFTQLLTTEKVKATNGSWYGYGFEVRLYNGNRCFGHGGGAPGQAGDLRICPQSGYVIATLANVDPPAAAIANYIANRLPLGP